MQGWNFGLKAMMVGFVAFAAVPMIATDAQAARSRPTDARPASPKSSSAASSKSNVSTSMSHTGKHLPVMNVSTHTKGYSKLSMLKGGKAQYGNHGSSGGLQCVPFARAASGIELKGNAANWWDAASGVYARGQAPESGSVLNFRSNGHMRLGHVAVVTRVVDSREIEIDHANWSGPGASKGGVSRAIPVVDVSAANDWSEVRVGLGHTGSYGSVYPTYGFIYDRPDNGVMAANTLRNSDPARYDEVAEAPNRAVR